MFNLKEILARYSDIQYSDTEVDAKQARRDARVLALYVRARMERIRRYNADLPEPEDLCPVCAGYTWGRPQHGGMDFERRQCSECGEIRQEPPEDTR